MCDFTLQINQEQVEYAEGSCTLIMICFVNFSLRAVVMGQARCDFDRNLTSELANALHISTTRVQVKQLRQVAQARQTSLFYVDLELQKVHQQGVRRVAFHSAVRRGMQANLRFPW